MNIKSISIFLFFLFNSLNFSQTNSDLSNSFYNHELQFYVVNEIIAAYKFQFNDISAIRLKLNVTGLFNDEDSDEIEHYEKSLDTLMGTEKRESIYSNHTFGITFQYLYDIKLHRITHLYFGGGPFVNYSFAQNESYYEAYSYNSQQLAKSYSKSLNNIWHLGISTVVGIECNVYENINLFTEYEAIFQIGWRNVNSYSNSSATYLKNNNFENIGYSLIGIRIGIGINF